MQGWIDTDTARKIFTATMGFIGVELDPDEIKAALEEEKAKSGYEDYKARNRANPDLKAVPNSRFKIQQEAAGGK